MTDTIRPGLELDGFCVGERLFVGGMASIFSVSQPGSTRPLLMKVPHAPSEAAVAFEMEATILPTLSGPHVPAFIAAADVLRTPYLVMERVEGQTLESRLSHGKLPTSELGSIGAALADALHSIHQQAVVHLDLKPANVLLRPDGSAVLIDFGFAHHARFPDLLAEERRFGVGSAPYVAPEQLLGKRDDPRTDLFALGVVLYELATGTLPFGEPDSDVRNRFWIDPTPPTVLAPELPPWFQEVILRCLEPRPEDRYQSAAHVAFDLRHPEQIVLTPRATKRTRAGLLRHAQRFLSAHREHAARLRSPDALLSSTPILLGAIDTTHLEDPRQPAIRDAIARFLAQTTEFRLICLAVIPLDEPSRDHLVRLRHWTEPLRLSAQRLTLHAVESDAAADVILNFAHHNNVDLIVLGAPSGGARAWSQSTASKVTALASCSVHVVRC